MTLILPFEQITAESTQQGGGKAVALAELQRLGYQIPVSLVISTSAYRRYLVETGLDAQILMELGRKDFQQMRWEELWDAALRIRNLFLTTPLPATLKDQLTDALATSFADRPLVIRSSAPGEDSSQSSFAGLHDSFVNICGRNEQLLAIRKVWASLWSDRALLYRQELKLAVENSSMAVLIQELIDGEKSGVAFSSSPSESSQLAIEAVHGLNQGLVDGSVEPDYWALDRNSLEIVDFRPAGKKKKLAPGASGLQLVPVTKAEQEQPVLTDNEVASVAQTALDLEESFSSPQDIEWTWTTDKKLILLQARPITTARQEEDPRSWYFNLHRSLENLQQLKTRIETEIMPGMEAEAASMAAIDLQSLTDQQLADEINRRREVQSSWEEAYRNDCIPMAHGIRLFGEYYNDALQPAEPFEFMELLRGAELRAVARNRKLIDLATTLRANPEFSKPLVEQLHGLAEEIGLPVALAKKLLLELARKPVTATRESNRELEKNYLEHFPAAMRQQATEILAVGRASYRLRDDDNISLERINREQKRAERVAEQRLRGRDAACLRSALTTAGNQTGLSSPPLHAEKSELGDFRARQLQGQPASPGLATAAARVIHIPEDLADFQAGEILVCDAIDPAMTFVVPLAAGIVERRGGMLIHGAIIAREYGIPCVSGIAAAADIIRTGDQLTIDGYLGLIFFPSSSGKLSLAGQTPAIRKELDDIAES